MVHHWVVVNPSNLIDYLAMIVWYYITVWSPLYYIIVIIPQWINILGWTIGTYEDYKYNNGYAKVWNELSFDTWGI